MAVILSLDTTTKICSVSIGVNGVLKSCVEQKDENYSHAEKLNLFVEQALKEAGISFSDLDAIAISNGPGSYTGLRIGTSTAKGFCYALNIPLISVDTLTSMNTLVDESFEVCIPMIDARRMEVYQRIFSEDSTTEIKATEIDNEFFAPLQDKKVAIFGDGAAKVYEAFPQSNVTLVPNIETSSRGMVKLAEEKFQANTFEDLAYYEPFYLKNFVAGKPKKIF